MSQFLPPVPPHDYVPPTPVGGYDLPPPARTNGAAVASLVLGILGCVPFIAGALAFVFGLIGLRRSREPGAGGFGLALSGLLLGILSVLCWSGCGGLMIVGYRVSVPARVAARQFITDVSSGNTAAAVSESDLTPTQVDDLVTQLKPMGAFRDATFMRFNADTNTGLTTLAGHADFANGQKNVSVTLIQKNGKPRVSEFAVQ